MMTISFPYFCFIFSLVLIFLLFLLFLIPMYFPKLSFEYYIIFVAINSFYVLFI